MNFFKTKIARIVAAGVVAAAGVTYIAVAANASAVHPDCTNLHYPLCPRSVAAKQVVDNSLPGSTKLVPGSVTEDRLSADVRTKLNQAPAAATPALAGAYYAVAYYDKGDTNAGAIATVACKAVTDTAISGGVQTVGLDATANSRNTPVSSSFPGRMDWATNTPKADRLDGWVVQFGGNAGATSDKAPEKVKVYALCVPSITVPVTETYRQSKDG